MSLDVYYYQDRDLNFGDDLNAEIWPAVLPPEILAAEDVTLIGIGSILTEERAGACRGRGRRIVVLGSGTSYGRPPVNIDDWIIKAVRGPLTAKVIGRPEAAITDGAILLAASGLLPEGGGKDVVFIPHHRSLRNSNWQHVCQLAGVRFQTPAAPVAEVLQSIADARLVITEAMHGAIVADTMRKPWVPVSLSPNFDEFKWLDWLKSMELSPSWERLPCSSALEAARNADVVRKNPYLKSGDRSLTGDEGPEELLAHLRGMYGGPAGRGPTLATRALRRTLRLFNKQYADRAAGELSLLTSRTGYLSKDDVFRDRLDRTLGRIEELRRQI